MQQSFHKNVVAVRCCSVQRHFAQFVAVIQQRRAKRAKGIRQSLQRLLVHMLAGSREGQEMQGRIARALLTIFRSNGQNVCIHFGSFQHIKRKVEMLVVDEFMQLCELFNL